MHEEHIVNSLINIIETKCMKDNIQNPRLVEVNIGIFNTYNRQMLIAKFDELKLNSEILKTTQLKVVTKHGKIKCNKCSEESEIDKVCDISDLNCPKCGSIDIEALIGEEIEVLNIEKVK